MRLVLPLRYGERISWNLLRSRNDHDPPVICLQCKPLKYQLDRTVREYLGPEHGLWEEAEGDSLSPHLCNGFSGGMGTVQYLLAQGKSCLWLLLVWLLMLVSAVFTGLNENRNKNKQNSVNFAEGFLWQIHEIQSKFIPESEREQKQLFKI